MANRIINKNGTLVNANCRERKDILTDGDRIIAIGQFLTLRARK
ncbi:MAG: hypothetical protein ACLU5K_01350 [Christensenellales bacterium]